MKTKYFGSLLFLKERIMLFFNTSKAVYGFSRSCIRFAVKYWNQICFNHVSLTRASWSPVSIPLSWNNVVLSPQVSTESQIREKGGTFPARAPQSQKKGQISWHKSDGFLPCMIKRTKNSLYEEEIISLKYLQWKTVSNLKRIKYSLYAMF